MPTLKAYSKALALPVIHDYKIEWARGYGWADTAAHRPVTTRTLFQAASVSKSVNAMGVLRLADQKKANLYEDILSQAVSPLQLFC